MRKLLVFLLIWPVLASLALSPALAADGEVVRVYEVPREDLNGLRRLGDFWGIDWREDYVVMLVTERGREALEGRGYRVERDHERHAERLDFLSIDRAAWARSGLGGIPGFPCYRTVDETTADLSALAAAHPDLARWEAIGQSWEAGQPGPAGDDLFVLVLGNQQVDHPQAPLLVMAAQHSRELVTAETATRFAEHLLNGYASDPVARWLLDHRLIHIVAQQNPDGRRKIEDDTASFWRKNTNDSNCGSLQYGVDLNRNSSFLYGDFSSTFCGAETYRGPGPASEPETRAIQDYMAVAFEAQRPVGRPGADLETPAPDDTRGIFLSLHSFGELVLLPWEGLGGQNENNAPNHDQLTILGRKLGFFTDYAVGRWSLLGPAGGTTVDYAYGEFGVAAYTMELGTTFLQSCSDFEQTIWPDNLDALLYAAKAAESPYLAPFGPEVTALSAQYNPAGTEIVLAGTADSSRYFRGGVPEPPSNDPIHPLASVVVSLDLPPALADKTYPLTLNGSGSLEDFSGTVPVPDTGMARLVYAVATDSEGNTGVPTPVWLNSQSLFEDRFESR
ncbi:MAG: M14 family zinc carboxypeptidase [Wenzhouxiangella sp.]|jgi:hypothetical protein|nr:M14 family zinc carboxypeptidase [Wenzhouxiangella sp.]